MKILRALFLVLALVAAGVGLALALTRPAPLPEGSESARRLENGPFAIGTMEASWRDERRPTQANGEFEGAPHRSFQVTIWHPVDAPGPHPLLVYSHGFMSTRTGGRHLAEHMASHGYVFVATDYPLTSFFAPGGPNALDVEHQPGDVSYLIDRMLALSPAERAFQGGIDRDRIGVLGLSLGGLTTTLVAFHPRMSDPRIRAALSIAGPTTPFGPAFFEKASLPFLMIGGTHDAMIPFDENAARVPGLVRRGGLVRIEGASHAGFSSMAAGPMRLLGNPDRLGCRSLLENLDLAPNENPFGMLGGPEDGLLDATRSTLPCEKQFDEALRPGRQHMLTTLAVHAFFESHFAEEAEGRERHATFLSQTFPAELEEVGFTPADGES